MWLHPIALADIQRIIADDVFNAEFDGRRVVENMAGALSIVVLNQVPSPRFCAVDRALLPTTSTFTGGGPFTAARESASRSGLGVKALAAK
jgi:hypothetical protein